ncbi:maleylpyruvate isomerase family mycothiol-dependent enzyme [Kitasatospora sp. McL0602]|uniref:maleylpyruvate isomerase family mycothiol-dependent enzyme n=1 Tax=Kitasatospora sp. McL0602 TaxID=3439530 RepID=UPI003F88DB5A
MEDLFEEVASSGARFAASVAQLGDGGMRAASALPGWSRGHVVSHVARSVDAYLWLLAVARTGAEPGPRADGAAIARAVEEGAGRSAAELAADLRGRLDQLAEAAAAMPGDRWDFPVTALAGWQHPARYTLRRCLRELETHHIDLAVGYRPTDWPQAYVSWALDDTFAALAARQFPLARVEATDLGRSWRPAPAGPVVTGPGHALLAWLSGRANGSALTTDGPLPAPPAWPLPLAPVITAGSVRA